MSPSDTPSQTCSRSFPRVSGDEPMLSKKKIKAFSFSPRERG